MTNLEKKVVETNLNEFDRHVFDWISKHKQQVIRMTLTELSSQLFISNSSIIRLCKKLDLDGFSELKYELTKELDTNIGDDIWRYRQLTTPLMVIRRNLKEVNEQALKRLVSLIQTLHPIYIFGNQLQASSAEYMHSMLRSLDYNCILISDLHSIKIISQQMASEDTMVLITSNADDDTFMPILENIRQQEATCFFITSDAESNLLKECDGYLLSAEDNFHFQETEIEDIMGTLSIIQLLIDYISD